MAANPFLTCEKCKYLGHSKPSGPFIQIGQGAGQKILIIAESPAKNGWRVSGKACYTPEGKLLATGKRLNEYLSKFGQSIETVSFTEMAKCYIDDRKKLEASGRNCSDFLSQQIECLKPELVITIGVITGKIFSEIFGRPIPIGEIYDLNGFKYLPLYHPSPANPTGHKKNLEMLKNLYRNKETP